MAQPQPLASVTELSTFQVRSHRKAQWFWLDNALIRQHARRLGPIGVMLYVALASYTNQDSQQCWPSVVRLSRELGLTRLTIRRYLTRLERHGLIHLSARPGASFVVTLLEVPDLTTAPGCLPGEHVEELGCLSEEGEGVYPVNRGCLPGEHKPDLMNQTKEEPAPKPPAAAAEMGRGEPLETWLASLDASTVATLEQEARETLRDEGVSPWVLIRPVIEARMWGLWQAQGGLPQVRAA